MSSQNTNVSHTEIRMFRLGTGDCFVIKFYSGKNTLFKLMIDGGCWNGNSGKINPYIKELKKYVNNKIDLLVITHEHKDHVHAFDVCEKLFTENFEIKEIWMGWSENDNDPKVKEWKNKFGERKQALFEATKKLKSINKNPKTKKQLNFEKNGNELFSIKQNFFASLSEFSELHFDTDSPTYKGLLRGMDVLKNNIAKNNIQYKSPGEIIEKKDVLPGVKFYILGPPLAWEEVKKEKGKKGEGYDHNKNLPINEGFSAAAFALGNGSSSDLIPFDSKFISNRGKHKNYTDQVNYWRNIDNDWLNSAGMLALRINSRTNNLSLAIAIEFVESGKVLLFPGDAEFGSWESWHNIDWKIESIFSHKQLTTEELLNRTVLYKVAHHLSHNGTAKKLGLDMMTNKDLVAMATLDYDIISPHWRSTMPNKAIIDDLLVKTKGKILIMNENNLPYDRKKNSLLANEILRHRNMMSNVEATNFSKNLDAANPLFIQFKIDA